MVVYELLLVSEEWRDSLGLFATPKAAFRAKWREMIYISPGNRYLIRPVKVQN